MRHRGFEQFEDPVLRRGGSGKQLERTGLLSGRGHGVCEGGCRGDPEFTELADLFAGTVVLGGGILQRLMREPVPSSHS
jgi:hypothetical protein